MILSTNFLKDYLDIDDDIDVVELAEKMTKMGNEYDSAEKLITATNLIIGEVLECEMHPDSDHLHVCKVNVGKDILQIVCGAPNVRKGLKVIVALNGAKLPGGEIKKSNIRGVESNGMICSIAELGIDSKFLKPEDKEGIHELPEEAPVGENPIKYMGMDDNVIDFDLTANRGDLLSILGMAYEVGAIYDKKVKPINLKHKESGKLDFKLNINTENCTLFLAKRVENIKIKESPRDIQEKLMASGIRPINNVVDISNYVMLETGQPLHFYDADKLNGLLEVRMAKEGEKLITLDNQERILTEEDIIISDGNKAIGLAGVMGGLDTEITENTKNVIIEAAIFNNVKIRKTSNKILRSEASNRFEKGLDPNRTYMAIERACTLLEEYADGEIIAGTEIYDKTNKEEKKIDITVSNINKVLGTTIEKSIILDCFKKLDFKYETEGDNDLITVIVPTRRIDISIKEDLIEEVGRIYGVDNIEGGRLILPVKKGSYDKTTREIRNKMVSLGLNETLSYVLVNEKESKMFAMQEKESIEILDPLTEERKKLRQSLIISLYRIYEYNKARNQENINLFEIGKSFYKNEEEYKEDNKLACLMTGDYYLGLDKKQVDFYVIKGVAEEILDFLGYSGRYSFIANNIPKDMHPGKTAVISVNGEGVGFVGRINPTICKNEVYVMEINLDRLLSKKTGRIQYKEFSKFPSVKKDISIIIDEKIEANEVQKVIKNAGGKLLQNSEVFDLYIGNGIPEGKKSIAFSIELGSKEATLTDEEIVSTMNKITENIEKKFNAELRK